MGINKSKGKNIEERLADLIRMFGTKNDSNGYRLGVSSMNIIVNGNFCEEYEDLEDAPCIINYIAVDSDDITPWFNMGTHFSTSFPLMSNDKYSIGAMGTKNIEKIINNIESRFGKTTKDAAKLIELRRTEWLKIIEENNNFFLFGIYYKSVDKKTLRGCDFNHAVDCIYCCYTRERNDDLGLNLNELKEHILNSIDKTAAFFIRVQYPTLKSLLDSSYLAGQNGERWARWNHIIPLIDKKINKLIKPEEVKELVLMDPSEALVDGRLKGQKKSKVDPIIKPKDSKKDKNKPCDYPNLYQNNNSNEDKWHTWFEKQKKIYAKKVEVLDHPRFEIILLEKYQKYYQRQIMGIVYGYAFDPDYNGKSKHPEYAKFYNGTTETSIPVDGTIVIDHFDKDKTAYLLGDVINICKNQYDKDPGKGFFCKINTPIVENIITFDYIESYDIDDRDWHHKNIYTKESIHCHDSLKKANSKKQNFEVSQRTGNSYMLSGYKARLCNETIKRLWNSFDETFKKDAQSYLDVEMKSFDHEKFALMLQESTSPIDYKTLDLLPKSYRRDYENYIETNSGYKNSYDIPRDVMLRTQRSWWNSIYREVLNNAIRIGRKDTLDYSLLEKNEEIIPCDFKKVGYYYLTPDEKLCKEELNIAEKVRLVVNAILYKKNKPAKKALA